MFPLNEHCKISSAVTPAAGVAGTTDIHGTVIDMAGFDSVAILVRMGAITSGAVCALVAQQGAESDGSDMADLTGRITVADDDDNEIFMLVISQPSKQYIRLDVERSVQNSVIASAEYIQYNAKTMPITQPTGTTVHARVTPYEATA